MSAAAGAVAGALGVIVLRAAVMHPNNASAGAGALTGLARRFLDPSVPAIPDVAKNKPTGAAGAQSGVSQGGVPVGPLPNTGLLPANRKRRVTVASSSSASGGSILA